MDELLKKMNSLSPGFRKAWRQQKNSADNMKKVDETDYHTDLKLLRKRIENPAFNSSEQVRILLFRERFGQDRRLLFDSKAVHKRDGNVRKLSNECKRISESSIERSFRLNATPENEYFVEWPKQNSDEKMLREMIFGSVSTSYQGSTLKIHTIKSPPQIVISVVFPAPSMASFHFGEQECGLVPNMSCCAFDIVVPKQHSCTDIHSAHSVPADVPCFSLEASGEQNYDSLGSFHSQDGNTSLPSCHLGTRTSSLVHSGSYNSLQRRLLQNKATSIELGFQSMDDESCHGGEFSKVQGESRIKLGLSIVILLHDSEEERSFEDFLFTHISLVENHIMDLKSTVIKAYLIRKKFLQFMYEGASSFMQSLQDLCSVPRLQFPEWLSIVSSDNYSNLSEMFIDRFSSLLRDYDRKETNFFVSTLLTAVLSNHLAWVPTVVPAEEEVCCDQSNHMLTTHWVQALARSRPYNPLWVQLSDLYGALSHPLRLVKVVVVGSDSEVVLKFLKVLSYFIRCSEIYEQLQQESDISHEMSPYNSGICEEQSDTCPESIDSVCSKHDGCDEDVSAACCTNVLKFQGPDQLDKVPKTTKSESFVQSVAGKSSNGLLDTAKLNCSAKPQCCSHCSYCTTHVPDHRVCEHQCCQSHSSDISVDGLIESLNCNPADQSKVMKLINSCVRQSHKCEPFYDRKKSVIKFLLNGDAGQKGNVKPGHSLISELTQQHCALEGAANNEKCQFGSINVCETDKHWLCGETDCKENNSIFTQKAISLLCSDKSLSKQVEAGEEGYQSMEEYGSGCESLPLSEGSMASEDLSPEGLLELTTPKCRYSRELPSPTLRNSFGWSLMAGVNSHFISDFCLQGVCGNVTEDELKQDLVRSTQVRMFGEPVSEAVCILANTDMWHVKVLTVEQPEINRPAFNSIHAGMSTLVSNMCEAVLSLKDLGTPAEACIIHLEDRLQEFYCLSSSFCECMRSCDVSTTLDKIASVMGLDKSDIPLLMAIASTQISWPKNV